VSPVQRLGGQHCAYYLRGRCTRTIGPDQSAATRCGLLDARRKLGAQTMDRLERLQRLADPDDREVARRHLIQKNVEAISRLSCPGLVPPPQGGMLCAHQHLVYCVLRLPACPGRCESFLRRRDFGEAKGEAK
jgi:hypothetical protein